VFSGFRTTNRFAGSGALLLFFTCVSCGPSLSEPSAVNITGHWTSSDKIGAVYNIVLDMTQQADGSVSGTWSGSVTPPNPTCPPATDTAEGDIGGTNTVLGVQLGLDGVGDFQGQVDEMNVLSGSLISCGGIYPITFSLAGPAPTG
jgi:hypothetical protein